MKWKFAVVAACGLLVSGCQMVPAQTTYGTNIASNWNNWRVAGKYNLVAGTNNNIQFDACYVVGDNAHPSMPAFAAGVPIKINDGNPALSEFVTPTNVTPGSSCYVTLVTVNAHATPYFITSGTYGLDDAITYNSPTAGLNVTNLNYSWHVAGGGAATIYSVTNGNANMALLDVSIAPNPTYRWNGSHYVPNYALFGTVVPTLAAGAAAGTAPTIANSPSSSGNIITAVITVGSAPATGTFFTETVGTPPVSGNMNSTVTSVGSNSVPFTFSTAGGVLTVTATTAPTAGATYTYNIEND